MIKDPAEIEGKEYKEEYLWLVPRVFSLSNMAPVAPERFFLRGGGRSGECLVGVRGSVCF